MLQSLQRSYLYGVRSSCTELPEDQCQVCYTIVPGYYTLAGANNIWRVNRPAKVGVYGVEWILFTKYIVYDDYTSSLLLLILNLTQNSEKFMNHDEKKGYLTTC